MFRILIAALIAAAPALAQADTRVPHNGSVVQAPAPTGSHLVPAGSSPRAFFQSGGRRLYAARPYTPSVRRRVAAGRRRHATNNEWRYVKQRRYDGSYRSRIRLRLKSFDHHARGTKKKPVVCGCKPQWERTKPH